MKQGWKTSLGLVAKVLVILALPLLLFRYVDSQPTAIVTEEPDKDTRNVAIVNEDIGVEVDSEIITLGQDIPSLLGQQQDYTWTVVNRSAAEQGFNNERYDAIIYVPSDFSESVMTFKEAAPKKASINYVIQPNLEAKNRQRIHKEMAHAKNAINQEMSTIYWSYVSQEVDNIKEQFDVILEKEIAFQEAMHSFYTPSSESLANEIDRLKNDLENILGQTSQIDDTSKGNVDAAADAEQKMADFTKALENYKEWQQEQQKMLAVAQVENKEAIKAGVDSYEAALNQSVIVINDGLKKQSDMYINFNSKIQEHFLNVNKNVEAGKTILNKWSDDSVKRKDRQHEKFEELNEIIKDQLKNHVSSMPDEILKEAVKNAKSKLNKAIEQIKSASGDDYGEEPVLPADLINIGFVDIDNQMQSLLDQINNTQSMVEPIEGIETTIEKMWEDITNEYSALNDELDKIKNFDQSKSENIVKWKNYADEWKIKYNSIRDKLKGAVASDVINKQNSILSVVKNENLKKELKEKFASIGDLAAKNINSLLEYSSSLTEFHTILTQEINVDIELIDEIFASQSIQDKNKEMMALFEVNNIYRDNLLELFGVSKEEIETSEKSFNEIANEAKEFLEEYNEQIKVNQEIINNLMDSMEQGANDITKQLQTVNAETFEWEESPSLGVLDGQMVFNTQQNTLTSLKHLSDMVSSLDESQSNITSSTSELQAKVGNVQQQSDELNSRWSTNVASTELVRNDVYDILGNTVVDGQTNPYVYNYLASPVDLDGQVKGQSGQVLAQTEDRLPPVIMFIIILISGLLIGFISNYYSNASYIVQGGLFILLNLAVGLIISIYGLNIYALDNALAIQWSIFTILLLFACSNIVRAGLFINPFVGWLASIGMIVFFITPIIDIIVPEFDFENPIASVYMAMQFGTRSTPIWTMAVLAVVILLVSAFVYALQIMRKKAKVSPNEEKAA